MIFAIHFYWSFLAWNCHGHSPPAIHGHKKSISINSQKSKLFTENVTPEKSASERTMSQMSKVKVSCKAAKNFVSTILPKFKKILERIILLSTDDPYLNPFSLFWESWFESFLFILK